ncbi:hypothetical protein [Streptomyces albireticuli]|uniref:DUF2304 domain-containing protein n=1 Tax=Streptomyces albireticuli TaxID=1940 RepID=A0A2A2D824_9ACTN|nr:hypothetical protein [Streptomyces albireticuli]MCD9144356.1 hypothetical protein [Streptomyces albireticuli]MCD9162001.1 hypothetical protein [Streptomyces albireticuli]MCD9193993.1 hypothetical protein [Streptomyces albireticuli]PAU47519.1 hypothetical protein CK936_18155 [Streptomyces albireticuli]
MAFNVSAVLLFGIAAVFVLKSRAAGFGSALILFLFGFFTAGTGAYGPIASVVRSLATALTDLA